MNKRLKIVLIGYGKMGKGIEKLAIKQGHSIHAIIDNESDWDTYDSIIGEADVAIEFTTPDTAPANIERCFNKQLAVVCGTTAWYQHLPRIVDLCKRQNQTLFHAPNFSIGVNIFFELNRHLANLMDKVQGYKVALQEVHHTQKLDAPSGTAVALANDIIDRRKDLKKWALFAKPDESGVLAVEALRIDNTPGTHAVTYNSPIDSIEIKHVAHSRDGFIQGALLAAEWVYDKQGVYTMKDLLNLNQ